MQFNAPAFCVLMSNPENIILIWFQTSKSSLFELVHDLFLLLWCWRVFQ